jgi:hypothetical protein
LNDLAAALKCEVSVFTKNIIVLQGFVLSRFRIGSESLSVPNQDPAYPFPGGNISRQMVKAGLENLIKSLDENFRCVMYCRAVSIHKIVTGSKAFPVGMYET